MSGWLASKFLGHFSNKRDTDLVAQIVDTVKAKARIKANVKRTYEVKIVSEASLAENKQDWRVDS